MLRAKAANVFAAFLYVPHEDVTIIARDIVVLRGYAQV